MKVTAMIDDKLINEAIRYSHAKSITEAVKTALKDYIAVHKLKEMSEEILKEPLHFSHSSEEIREINRDE